MGTGKMIGLAILAFVAILGLSTCGSYMKLVSSDETINGRSGDVRVQEQKRFDLVPNLVSTVEGAANFERGTLTEVTEMRAKVGQLIQLDAEALADPENQKRLVEASQQLSSALSRLIAVAESYPDLKAVQAYLTLQTQLEGIEDRIAYARSQVQEATVTYNTERRSPFGLLVSAMMGFKERPYFEAAPGSSTPPTVNFNTTN